MSRASASVLSTRLSSSGIGWRSREFQGIPPNLVGNTKRGSVIAHLSRRAMRYTAAERSFNKTVVCRAK
jgi:hypothetical protein